MTDLSTTAGRLADLAERLAEVAAPVGEEAVAAAHEAGRLTARERVLQLLDPDSFVEIDALARHRVTEFGLDATRPVTDGVVTGYGTIDGRKVCVFAQDASIFSGKLGEGAGEKIVKLQQLAAKTGVPLIGCYEGAGPRAAEGVAALSYYATIMRGATTISGLVPQLALVTGDLTGGHALLPALADLVIMVEGTELSVTDPEIISQVSGQTAEVGAHVHATRSGVAHLVAANDAHACELARELIGFMPLNNRAEAPRLPEARITGSIADNVTAQDRELDTLIPDADTLPYDMTEAIVRLLDGGIFREIHEGFAANIIIGFGRIEGRAVGILANRPTELAGCLSAAAANKAARFIRLCDAFNLPVITLVDAPGFLPDPAEELGAVASSAAKLSFAFAEASVGLITVILRKAMGVAYSVLASKGLGADLVFAWPTAQIAALPAATAVPEIHAAELAKAQRKGKDVAALGERLTAEYEADFLTPYRAAELGVVDAVIPPHLTRGQLVEGLRLLDRKVTYPPAKKHGNIAL